MDEWTDEWTDGWMNGQTDGWIDRWTNRLMDGWMDERTDRWIIFVFIRIPQDAAALFTQINFIFAKLATSHENQTKLLFLQDCFLSTESDPFSVTITVIIYLWWSVVVGFLLFHHKPSEIRVASPFVSNRLQHAGNISEQMKMLSSTFQKLRCGI